jgi:arylsulfatase A-like enzyme
LYDREKLPLAAFQEHAKNSPELAYHASGELRNYPDIPPHVQHTGAGNHIRLTTEKQRELLHGYYAAISYTDAQVGILLNTLDSLGTLNNTIIVLWGDHGWHLGDHDMWNKHSNFEQATRAPLLIAAPGYKSGKTSSVTEHLDIFPTICDLAGVAVPAHLQGKSLKPLMAGIKSTVKPFAVSQYPRSLSKTDMEHAGYKKARMMGYSLRNERYRLTVWMNDFTSAQPYDEKKLYATELYDYRKDPLEKTNVAGDLTYTSIKEQLFEEMKAFFKQHEKIKTD